MSQVSEATACADSGEAAEFGFRRSLFHGVPSWLVSGMVHAVLVLLLALFLLPEEIKRRHTNLSVVPVEELDDFDFADVVTPEFEPNEQNSPPNTEFQDFATRNDKFTADLVASANEQLEDLDVAVGAGKVSIEGIGNPLGESPDDWGMRIGEAVDENLSDFRKMARKSSSSANEVAVTLALQWIVAHQNFDGGWSFDHRGGQCKGRCSYHGALAEARNGATALALLPLLGAGNTHMEGEHKQAVKRGIQFLLQRMKGDGSLHEPGGTMYSHGLAAIALCEAFAMTRDRNLAQPAQLALDFIAKAQDPVGGGWRYSVKQPGDTSVVGWQLMALKSGHMGYLRVQPATIAGTIRFLDGVQTEYGAGYGYTTPGHKHATTAIGLLCRMYLGWRREHPALVNGMEKVIAAGPSKHDMYFNYYAAQLMRHYDDDPSKQWEKQLKEYLYSSQGKDGHAKGSWQFTGGHGSSRGGRLYNTAMATMILEVRYRHLPIYHPVAVREDFPL